MMRAWHRLAMIWLLLLCGTLVRAEKVADLPIPTTYVNDFAHVLSPAGAQRIEDLSLAAQNQAHANLFVVTIKTLDDGQSIEEFTAALEEKWKAGQKDVDRSALLVLVVNPQKLRIETGYGLEGILNDAKVGAILDRVKPLASVGDYDNALLAGDQGLAEVIGQDAGVTITPVVHTYHRAPDTAQQPQGFGLGRILLGVGFVIVLLILVKTGNIGWAFYLLMSVLGNGGGGGGGGGRDDDEGGGFGGIGGGASGGGGASRDY